MTMSDVGTKDRALIAEVMALAEEHGFVTEITTMRAGGLRHGAYDGPRAFACVEVMFHTAAGNAGDKELRDILVPFSSAFRRFSDGDDRWSRKITEPSRVTKGMARLKKILKGEK